MFCPEWREPKTPRKTQSAGRHWQWAPASADSCHPMPPCHGTGDVDHSIFDAVLHGCVIRKRSTRWPGRAGEFVYRISNYSSKPGDNGKEKHNLIWWRKLQKFHEPMHRPATHADQATRSSSSHRGNTTRLDPACSGSQMTTPWVTMTWPEPCITDHSVSGVTSHFHQTISRTPFYSPFMELMIIWLDDPMHRLFWSPVVRAQ